MFLAALENESTAPNYVLITVTDLKTNETKEICTEAPFIEGTMHRELNLGHDKESIKKVMEVLTQQKNLHFSFQNEKALKNISFFEYDTTKLADVRKKYDVDLIIDKVQKKGKYEFSFNGNRLEQLYISHLFLQKDITVRHGDIAGNYLILDLFNK